MAAGIMWLWCPDKQECVAILEHSWHLKEQPLLQQPPERLRHLPPTPVQPQQQRIPRTRGELLPIALPACPPAAVAPGLLLLEQSACVCSITAGINTYPHLQGNCISSSPVTVVVTDTCPQCDANHLDVSADAFAQVRHDKAQTKGSA